MQSFLSRLMPLVITIRGGKRRYRSAEATLAHITRLAAHPVNSAPPGSLARSVDVTRMKIAGWHVYVVSPRGAATAKRGLYLHGGSYVYEIAPQHWTLVADLVASAGIAITVPIFPLAPVETAATMVPKAADLAQTLVAEVGADNVMLLGDSAGGGMALAVSMLMRDRGVAPLQGAILIAPWLDISGSDPELTRLDARDPWLAVPGSVAAGDLYRGELPNTDPLVSPINGSLDGLGPLTVFSGTRDILNADAHRLNEKATAAGHPLDFHEVPEMIHNYPLLPIPEARAARDVMRRAIAG
ncbi:MAG: alpha/beta hydrolase [Actinomycetota bacterium]